MLRILGVGLIITGCSSLGVYYRNQILESYRWIRYLEYILDLFISEIRYGKSTLPECCRQISEKLESPLKEAMNQIYLKTHQLENNGFCGAWKECMEEALKTLPLSRQEKNFFIGISSSIGQADYQMQVKALEQTKSILKHYVQNREEALEKQTGLAMGIGVMGGLILSIVFI